MNKNIKSFELVGLHRRHVDPKPASGAHLASQKSQLKELRLTRLEASLEQRRKAHLPQRATVYTEIVSTCHERKTMHDFDDIILSLD